MIKIILLDFSFTLCFPKTKETIKSLNGFYADIVKKNPGANPLENFIINQELLDYLQTIKTTYKIYIFTSGSMHTDPAFAQKLNPTFDGYFTSADLGMPKSFPDAYKIIANKLNVNTDDLLFVDDQQANIQAATIAGAHAIRYVNNNSAIEAIKQQLALKTI